MIDSDYNIKRSLRALRSQGIKPPRHSKLVFLDGRFVDVRWKVRELHEDGRQETRLLFRIHEEEYAAQPSVEQDC